MSYVPHRLLFRMAITCRYVPGTPDLQGDELVSLPEECSIPSFAALEGKADFADLRLAWNDDGLAIQLEIRGKEQPAAGDIRRPGSADGLTLWLDTRDARASHRASRYCHEFHFLAAGAGPDGD